MDFNTTNDGKSVIEILSYQEFLQNISERVKADLNIVDMKNVIVIAKKNAINKLLYSPNEPYDYENDFIIKHLKKKEKKAKKIEEIPQLNEIDLMTTVKSNQSKSEEVISNVKKITIVNTKNIYNDYNAIYSASRYQHQIYPNQHFNKPYIKLNAKKNTCFSTTSTILSKNINTIIS